MNYPYVWILHFIWILEFEIYLLFVGTTRFRDACHLDFDILHM